MSTIYLCRLQRKSCSTLPTVRTLVEPAKPSSPTRLGRYQRMVRTRTLNLDFRLECVKSPDMYQLQEWVVYPDPSYFVYYPPIKSSLTQSYDCFTAQINVTAHWPHVQHEIHVKHGSPPNSTRTELHTPPAKQNSLTHMYAKQLYDTKLLINAAHNGNLWQHHWQLLPRHDGNSWHRPDAVHPQVPEESSTELSTRYFLLNKSLERLRSQGT